MRDFDPNFSRIVFDDFCYALYARVHHARGTGDLARHAPYLSEVARKALTPRGTSPMTEVRGIVVGAMEVGGIERLDSPVISVDVTYDANMTEVFATHEATWYVKERWRFERRRDILSPPPQKAKAEHCPRCGAALQTRTDGSCEYCGVKISDGSFQWYVRSITPISREPRGPLLTSNVPEQGTELPSVVQRNFVGAKKRFEAAHPRFRWEDLIARVREIAIKLQDAWTARDWERVRPLETEPLFQTHRYWIDEYIKQRLKNSVDGFTIQRIDPVKVDSDAFYDAITVRMWAYGHDYTIDESGNVVAGSREQTRWWSEYWTMIRTRGTDSDPSATVSCPNCGAAVRVGMTGTCSSCGGKLTGGDFGWILSRIEQDEAYTG
ncbi:MAG TPA: transporter [Thermoanaerobaculia bacterium]|nr:transporter [Thermoanaerobaculia bacterium]